MNLFSFARTFPENNGIVVILFEEGSMVLCVSNKLDLIWMGQGIKYAFHWVNGIYNDYDMISALNLDHLINSTFDNK